MLEQTTINIIDLLLEGCTLGTSSGNFVYLAAALSQCPTFFTPTLFSSVQTWTFAISIDSGTPSRLLGTTRPLAIHLLLVYANDNAARQLAGEGLCESNLVIVMRA